MSDDWDDYEREKALIAMKAATEFGDGWYDMDEGSAYDTDDNSSVPSLCENVLATMPNTDLALTGLEDEEPIWVKPLMVSIPETGEGEVSFSDGNTSRSHLKHQSTWVTKRFNGHGKYMGVRTDGFEEAIMELMSATEINLEDDHEGFTPKKKR